MIYFESCEETLKRFQDNSIDLIITSPPYNIGKMHSNRIRYGTYANNDMKESDYQNWQIEILNECYRVLSENGSMFYNHKVRIKDGRAIHPIEWVCKSKFILKQEITWDMGKSANCDKIRFFPFSERIYWLTKNPKVKLLNKSSLSDVWRLVPTHQRKEQKHIAVMPDGIVQNILDSIPNKPNVVYDPFGGTGTTMKVCKEYGYECIISEIDKGLEDTILDKTGNIKCELSDSVVLEEEKTNSEPKQIATEEINEDVIFCPECGCELTYETGYGFRECFRCLNQF